MKKTVTIVALVLAAAALFSYAVVRRSRSLPPEKAAAPGRAPVFTLPAAKGGEISLSSYAGKPVMFMFFTEGCPYCRAAGPALEKLNAKYGPEGLGVLGICLDDKQAALNFAGELGITFPLAYDGRKAFREYRARGVPYIYLVDPEGGIYDVWEGFDESYLPSMRGAVEKLLREK